MPRHTDKDNYILDVWQRTQTIGEILEIDGVPTDIVSAEAMLQLAAHIFVTRLGREAAVYAIQKFALHVQENRKMEL